MIQRLSVLAVIAVFAIVPSLSFGEPLVLKDWIDRPAYTSEFDRGWLDGNVRWYSSVDNCRPKFQLPESYSYYRILRLGPARYNDHRDGDPLMRAYAEGYRHWTLCYYHFINSYEHFQRVEETAGEFVGELSKLDTLYFVGDSASIDIAFPPTDHNSWYEHPIHEQLEGLIDVARVLPEGVTEQQQREARLCFDLTTIAMLLCKDAGFSDSMRFVVCHHMMRSVLSTELVPDDREERLKIHESLCRDLWEYQVEFPMLLATAEASRIVQVYRKIWGDRGRDYVGILCEAMAFEGRYEPYFGGYACSFRSPDRYDRCLDYAYTLPWSRRTYWKFLRYIPEGRVAELRRYAVSELTRTIPAIKASAFRNADSNLWIIEAELSHDFYYGVLFCVWLKGKVDGEEPRYSMCTFVADRDMRAGIAVCTKRFLVFLTYSYDSLCTETHFGVTLVTVEQSQCRGSRNIIIPADAFPPGVVDLLSVLPAEAIAAIEEGAEPEVKCIDVDDDGVEVVIAIGNAKYGIKTDKANKRSCVKR